MPKVNFRSPCRIYGGAPPPEQSQHTVVILGVPRGGTTMVAGVAQRCGLYIGDGLLGNLEDPCFIYKSVDEMRGTIDLRNAAHDIWGWKFPRAADYLASLLPLMRNPRMVVVFRDVVANMARSLRKRQPEMKAMRSIFRMQRKNIDLIEAAKLPALLVSYERAIVDPVGFAEGMAEFMGLPMPGDLDELRKFMEHGSYKPSTMNTD